LLASACKKEKVVTNTYVTNNEVTPPQQATKFYAKINNLPWASVRSIVDTGKYLAARVADMQNGIMIKGFGKFLNSSSQLQDDAIFINLENVTDTGVYNLSFNSYIAYSLEDSTGKEYYSSQLNNIGFVHITYLDADKISGTFEFEGNSTNGRSSIIVKEGQFNNIYFEK